MDFDAIVVGGGAAGGAITWQLARNGLKVACLERGPWMQADTTRRQRLTGNCRSAAPSHRYRLIGTAPTTIPSMTRNRQ